MAPVPKIDFAGIPGFVNVQADPHSANFVCQNRQTALQTSRHPTRGLKCRSNHRGNSIVRVRTLLSTGHPRASNGTRISHLFPQCAKWVLPGKLQKKSQSFFQPPPGGPPCVNEDDPTKQPNDGPQLFTGTGLHIPAWNKNRFFPGRAPRPTGPGRKTPLLKGALESSATAT